ncbi:MAG: hypothetical protein A2Y73_07940 [Chloroflexi bacterium RBG_13_56_8]|nr:MAG: hypothetical protein A2Y73_07940 [Chloroflexi bacterium RBG_13_56_8]
MAPKVSVVMSVYNGASYLPAAVESILGQTFSDFEFIIVDDGSTDQTSKILQSFRDERIVLLKNNRNLGLTKSLNRGLERARGEYIARLDADDISLPERLARQVQYLDAHPELGLVASAVVYIDPDGNELGVQRIRTRDFYSALLDVDFVWEHSATMFRTACVQAVGPYRDEFKYMQDVDLWLRIGEKSGLMVLGEPLIKLRLHPESIGATVRVCQREYGLLAVRLAKQRKLGGEECPGTLLSGLNDIGRLMAEPEAIGWALLRTACLYCLLGDMSKTKRTLAEAVQAYPALLQDSERVVGYIVYFGFDHAAMLTSREGAIRFVRNLFANLPSAAQSLVRFRSRALGQLYILSAFESYGAGHMQLLRKEIVLGVANDLGWLRNRGIWSMFFRSLLGFAKRRKQQCQSDL